MKKANYAAIAILALLGGVVIYLTNELPDFNHQNTTGPAFFPRLLVGLLFLLLVLLLITTIKSEDDKPVQILSKDAVRSYTMMGIVLGYLVVFNTLGFLLSTVIFLTVGIHFLSSKKVFIQSVGISLMVTLLIYVVFRILLQVPIPGGLFIG